MINPMVSSRADCTIVASRLLPCKSAVVPCRSRLSLTRKSSGDIPFDDHGASKSDCILDTTSAVSLLINLLFLCQSQTPSRRQGQGSSARLLYLPR